MRVLVCGGRDYADARRLGTVLTEVFWTTQPSEIVIIHGGATGADELADRYGRQRQVKILNAAAGWSKIGKRRGPARNQGMLDKWQPNLVVACPGDSTTADMIRRARAAGIPVKEVER